MIVRLQDLDPITPSDVAAALERNDLAELRLMAVTVALSDLELSLSQSICVRLCANPDSKVRGNALIGLGHLARRYRKLDEPIVKPLIVSGLQDIDVFIHECAKSAADEIHQFLHWDIPGHVFG